MYQFTKSSKTILFFIFFIASFFIGYIFSISFSSRYPLSAHEYYPYLVLYVLIYLSMLKYFPDNFNIQNISDSFLAMWLRGLGGWMKGDEGINQKIYIYLTHIHKQECGDSQKVNGWEEVGEGGQRWENGDGMILCSVQWAQDAVCRWCFLSCTLETCYQMK